MVVDEEQGETGVLGAEGEAEIDENRQEDSFEWPTQKKGESGHQYWNRAEKLKAAQKRRH